jgi:pimeloyl-ACP methyl ester carboxylesterase
LILGAIVLYLTTISFAPLLDRLVLFPSTSHIDAGAAKRRGLPFEGGELEVWTATSTHTQETGRPDLYVLRFYGNADRADRWVAQEADMWNGRSVAVWGMNYPGFGGSTGPARLARIGPAARAAFDALKREAGDRPIIVFGASIGATVALDVAAHCQVAGLILHNPPPLREIMLRQFGWWNLWLLAGPLAQKVPGELDSIANARAVRGKAIFLLSGRDEVVAPRYQKLVVDAYRGEKRVIELPGAGHNSPLDEDSLTKLNEELDWLLPRR